MWFTSDNAGPAAPEVMAALAAANAGYAGSYGGDDISARVTAQLRALFEAPEAAVRLVATGTAANALALATLCPPWGAIYAHAHAHVEEDECGAPEFFTGGAKIVRIEGRHGRMTPEALGAALAAAGRVGVHNVQAGALSLTDVTEAGTLYRPAEIAALAGLAKGKGIPVHLDGARFANAIAALGCTPAELTWKAGVDAVSFGGTKNGLLGVEAVILFDPAKDWELQLRRKRGGHLFSKYRYLAAQMDAYLTDGLWLRLAARANAMAARLAAGLAARGANLLHPVEANMMFASLPCATHRRLRAAGARYYIWDADESLSLPDDTPLTCRLVCNWATREEDVDAFLAAIG